jgi:ABC-type glucose/galactose transport system permease subunit
MTPLLASKFHVAVLSACAAHALHGAAQARDSASESSEASLVPVAISVALPVALVAGLGSVVVTGVQASAEGTVWLVENVADGVKGSVRFAGGVASVAGMAVGTVIVVSVVATGTVLSAAGRVIAFIPNEIGRRLSYNQRVSR